MARISMYLSVPIRMTNDFNASMTFESLVDFFNDRNSSLLRYLRWQVKCPETAEELAQETYLRFLRQPDASQVNDLNAFLFTIAANLARDHLRSLSRSQARDHLPLDPELEDPSPSTEELVESQCLEQRLERAIAAMPEKTREAFLLYRVEGLKYREIGERMGLSERTVEYHIRQAMMHCRRSLTNDGPA